MSNIYTYAPSEVVLTFAGQKVEGWTSINITRNAQMARQIRGIRGKHTKVTNRKDTSCTITLTCDQTSETNTLLSRILEVEKQYGTVRLEIMLKDTGGGSVFKTNEAYLGGYPSITYSAGLEGREWIIYCDIVVDWKLKGNGENSSDFLSTLSNLF